MSEVMEQIPAGVEIELDLADDEGVGYCWGQMGRVVGDRLTHATLSLSLYLCLLTLVVIG